MRIMQILEIIVPYICAVLESIGILIIVVAAISAFYQLVRSRFDWDQEQTKVRFARALAYSLEFKLAAEIIKTVVVHKLDEFLVLASVVALRVVLTFVIHWEIRNSNQRKTVEQPAPPVEPSTSEVPKTPGEASVNSKPLG